MDGSPTVLTVIAEAVDVATEVRGKATIAMQPLTLVTYLIVQDVGLDLHLRQQKP